MSITTTRKYFAVNLGLKDYVSVVHGEHKSLLKFYIHPDSVQEERWILRLSRTEEPKVCNIIRNRFQGKQKFVQIEKKMLDTVSRTIFSDMISAVVEPVPVKNQNQLILTDLIAKKIISLSHKRISETARKFRNKSLRIAVKITIVTLKLSTELNKEIEEIVRRNNNGSIPASFESVSGLERVKLKENSLNKCVICFKKMVAGSTMIRTKCSHEFHAECITEWFSGINLCPRCRFEMPRGIYDGFLLCY